ncbi:MAG: hypothetical protein IJA32_03230 [Lachnospiraceae bacterium]|nr:hypothetical protein [Lachnospiraceae bacterium]
MRYELKKLFGNKILIFGCLLSACYLFYTSYGFLIQRKSYVPKIDLGEEYEQCLGEYSEEKFAYIEEITLKKQLEMEKNQEEEELFYEWSAYQRLYVQAQNFKDIMEYRERVQKNAKKLQNSEDSYTTHLNQKIEKLFSKNIEYELVHSEKSYDIIQKMMVLEYTDMINICLLLAASCILFTQEHQKNTFPLIYTSKHGRKKVYRNKAMTTIFLAFVLSFFTTVIALILTTTYGGFKEWMDPIQNVSVCKYSPYHFNVFELVIIITFLRGLGYAVIASVAMVISLLFQRNILPLIINTVLFAGSYALSVSASRYTFGEALMEEKYHLYRILKRYSPFYLIQDGIEYFMEYKAVNIFGYPVSEVAYCIIIQFMVLAVILLTGNQIYVRSSRKSGVLCWK